MNKTKLAICMKDLEYQDRFVSCFMNHYNHQYELHVFTSPEQMEEPHSMEYAVIITGEYNTDEMTNFVERGKIILKLEEEIAEEEGAEEKVVYAQKYQEVYKIAEYIERLVEEVEPRQKCNIQKSNYEIIGIYSLSQEVFQAPFAALLGKIYGQRQKVLVLDLQSYSGLSECDETNISMGIEDLLSVVATGNYSKSRVLECIRHEGNWDYVCPAQNHQCLAEGSSELYEAMLDLFGQELGYETIIVNFGTAFWGQLDMMENCQYIYLLKGKEGSDNWRERCFMQELLRQGKEHLTQIIKKMEISSNWNREATWRMLAEKWMWGDLGESIRQRAEREKTYGAVM